MIVRCLAVATLIAAATVAQAQSDKPRPASALLISNARAVPATDVSIGVGEEVLKVSKPLASKANTTLKLPKMSGCLVSVAATFADESVVEVAEFDVCKEKTVRFTD